MAEFRLAPAPAIARPPVEVGGTCLAECAPQAVTTLVLPPGNAAAAAPLPTIGRSTSTANGPLLRPSRERAYLLGPAAGFSAADSVHSLDQTGFWSCLALTGPGARAVLERVWRPDLGDAAFPPGAVARSALSQIPVILWRDGAASYRLMAPRSYAESLFQELEAALARVL